MKSVFKRFIDRLGAASEKEFGGRAPSCCSGKVQQGSRQVSRKPVAKKGPTGR